MTATGACNAGRRFAWPVMPVPGAVRQESVGWIVVSLLAAGVLVTMVGIQVITLNLGWLGDITYLSSLSETMLPTRHSSHRSTHESDQESQGDSG